MNRGIYRSLYFVLAFQLAFVPGFAVENETRNSSVEKEFYQTLDQLEKSPKPMAESRQLFNSVESGISYDGAVVESLTVAKRLSLTEQAEQMDLTTLPSNEDKNKKSLGFKEVGLGVLVGSALFGACYLGSTGEREPGESNGSLAKKCAIGMAIGSGVGLLIGYILKKKSKKKSAVVN